MWQLIRRIGKWLAHFQVEYLETIADALPSQDQVLATMKRIRYYETHLKEGTNWRFSKQIMEVRLMADERLLLMTKCVNAARRATKFDPNRQLSEELAGRLVHALGKAPSNFEEATQSFRACRTTWEKIVSEARQVRNPLFASQVFFRLSEQSRLQIASLVIGGLIASGALQMLFFYRAAAEQFVFAYWVWDDLVIQAINVVPIALLVLGVSEMLFRVLRWFCEKSSRPWLVLLVLHHPTGFALSFFLFLMFSASFWGYHQGVAVWDDFKRNKGGKESATMLDQTHLTGVHLVGTTSRTAVFLQAKPESSICRPVPGYRKVLIDVVCAQPFPWCPDAPSPEASYRVYVMDRDKIVCHAKMGQCEEIPPRTPMVMKQGDDQQDPAPCQRNDDTG